MAGETAVFFSKYGEYTVYVGKEKLNFHKNHLETSDPAVIKYFRSKADKNVTEVPGPNRAAKEVEAK